MGMHVHDHTLHLSLTLVSHPWQHTTTCTYPTETELQVFKLRAPFKRDYTLVSSSYPTKSCQLLFFGIITAKIVKILT